MSIQTLGSLDRVRPQGLGVPMQAPSPYAQPAYGQDGFTRTAPAGYQPPVYQPQPYQPSFPQQSQQQNIPSFLLDSVQPQQQGYAPQQPAYAPQQQTYAPQQPAYAPQQPAYAPQQQTYAPQQPAYAPQQPAYAPQQPAYAPQQPAYAPQQPTYAPQQQPYQPQYAAPQTDVNAQINAMTQQIQTLQAQVQGMQAQAPQPYAPQQPSAPQQAYPQPYAPQQQPYAPQQPGMPAPNGQTDPRSYGPSPRRRGGPGGPGAPVPENCLNAPPPLPGVPGANNAGPYAQPQQAYPQQQQQPYAPQQQPYAPQQQQPYAPQPQYPAQQVAPAQPSNGVQRIDLPGIRAGQRLTLDNGTTLRGHSVSGDGTVNTFDGQNLDMTVNASAAMGFVKMTLHFHAQVLPNNSIHLTAGQVSGGREESMIDQTLSITSAQSGNVVLNGPQGQASLTSDGRGGFVLRQGADVLSFHTS